MRYSLLSCPPALFDTAPTRWYVVFCEVNERHWWDRLFRTPPGFSHVYALRWDGFNWILFNPHSSFTDVAIVAGADENALRLLVEPDAIVIEVQVFRAKQGIRGRWWNGPMTCVEQIKALLGLPVARIWTPWQLYRYLDEECTDGIETRHTRPNRAGKRTRTPPAQATRRIDRRRKRAVKGH